MLPVETLISLGDLIGNGYLYIGMYTQTVHHNVQLAGARKSKSGHLQRGGVRPNWTNVDKGGGEGVQKPGNFADVINGWPLTKHTNP